MDFGRIEFGPVAHQPYRLDTVRMDAESGAFLVLPDDHRVEVGTYKPKQLSEIAPSRRDLEDRIVGKYLRYMPVARSMADMSKESTKVGAVVLGADQEPLSSGWNGAPRGSRADADERGVTRDERLKWMVHAEANAIANAARTGARLKDSTMVVTHVPCIACANLVVQAGIKRVITNKPDGAFAERWREDNDRARRLFKECGVEFIEIDTIATRA